MGRSKNPAKADSVRVEPLPGTTAASICSVCGRPANDPWRRKPYGCVARIHDAFLERGSASYRFVKAAVKRFNAHPTSERSDGWQGQ